MGHAVFLFAYLIYQAHLTGGAEFVFPVSMYQEHPSGGAASYALDVRLGARVSVNLSPFQNP